MAKKQSGPRVPAGGIHQVESLAKPLADELGLELVEVVLQKESRGKCLCIYLDKEGGLTLDDCERYHKRIQPLLEDVEYDFLEVSSPGADRPVKTQRDFEKNKDALVEVRLFAPVDGSKLYQGKLSAMDDDTLSIRMAGGEEKGFPRKAIAVVKPVIEVDFSGEEA